MPLDMLKYLVDQLKESQFEPLVNFFLFIVFLSAVILTVRLLLGKKLIHLIFITLKKGGEQLCKSTEYSPEFESYRKKISPYIELISSIYMGLLGFFYAAIIALLYHITEKQLEWFIHPIIWIFILGSFLYARINLAQASWAWNKIKNKKT